MTVREALAVAERRLAEAGCATPWLDARVLLAHATGWSETRLVAGARETLAAEAESAFEAAVARRARREPVAYVTGEKEFFSLVFAVDARVLVPRPETEVLVEAALEFLRGRAATAVAAATAAERPVAGSASASGPLAVDVGTGSGAIALALAHALAEDGLGATVRLVALDVSGEALAVARANARRLAPAAVRPDLVRGDLTSALRAASVDLVAANPPYLSPADLDGAPPELAFEPRLALAGGGSDGLERVAALLADARRILRPGGRILCEIGSTQGENAVRLAESSGFESAKVLRDLSGVARVLVADATGTPGRGGPPA